MEGSYRHFAPLYVVILASKVEFTTKVPSRWFSVTMGTGAVASMLNRLP